MEFWHKLGTQSSLEVPVGAPAFHEMVHSFSKVCRDLFVSAFVNGCFGIDVYCFSQLVWKGDGFDSW